MQLYKGRVLYSATDLNEYLACEYLTTLELDHLRQSLPRPARENDESALLSRLGDQHELRYLERLRSQGRDVAEIDRGVQLVTAVQKTLEAMRAGREYVYQGAFFDGDWMGRTDFLRRVPNGNGSSGSQWQWHYEVEDAKLSRHTEPYFLLQLCYYSDHVARVQGVVPENMYVVPGDESIHAFRYSEFAAYYREVRRRFLTAIENGGAIYPIPVDFCELCSWRPNCDERWIADDHLKLVANITRLQTARLNGAGIAKLAQLGTASPEPCPPKMEQSTFAKLRRQARLQLAQRKADEASNGVMIPPEFLPHSGEEWRKKGFALLPKRCDQDVFFDMEGDPYYDVTASLEYMFGLYTEDDKQYRLFWGCDRSGLFAFDRLAEKRAFEQFIDFIMDRHRRYPEMHVYHYAAYEKTKLKELSIRHATREDEVDAILRGNLLVDLYTVVRQSIAVGQPGYSIKLLEAYYGKRGDAAIKTGGESILRFEEWLQSRGDRAMRNDKILDELATYNRYDCVSTLGLRDWLLDLRESLLRQQQIEIPFFTGVIEERPEPREDRYQDLKDRLDALIPSDFDPESGDKRFADMRPLWMARQTLEYHWREDKPVYWLFHDRCERYQENPTELLDDGESLIHLEFVDSRPEGGRSRSQLERYRFPLQEFKLDGGECFSPVLKVVVGDIDRIEEDGTGGVLTIKRGPKRLQYGALEAIVVRTIIPPRAVRDALATFAENLLQDGSQTRFTAGYDMLTRAKPRRRSGQTSELQPARPTVETISPILDDLERSYLFIQGPPGSGKTYTAARLIVHLLYKGHRVGVSANSHKAIHNLLSEIEEAAHQSGCEFVGVKQITDDPDSEYESKRGLIMNEKSFTDAPPDATLFAGTAWAICKGLQGDPLDFLFIDEAGQVAFPHAIAMSTSTENVVLLGDPLQLSHVSHTTHPGGIGQSVLEFLLGEELRPVSPDRGILLTESYRMNVPVCSFVSDNMYEGRLRPAPQRERQRVDGPGITGQGLRFMRVEHQNNRQRSIEEAERICAAITKLLAGTVTDHNGNTRPLTPADVIVVTPYNAQVRCIRQVLRNHGPVVAEVQAGTVDRFQGREAHVVFFSTAASSAEDAPRGVGFIFDRNRFNVAISRAKSVAVLVGSPQLMRAPCTTVEQARALNSVLHFIEHADSNSPDL